jgi:hypothetical protein
MARNGGGAAGASPGAATSRRRDESSTAGDDLAVGHFYCRRLEAACRPLRASVTRSSGPARARLVRELERLVDEAEALARRGTD